MLRHTTFSILLVTTALVAPHLAHADDPVFSYGEQGVSEGEFNGATGIDIDGEGRVFITDRQRNRILHFETDGDFVAQSAFFFPGPPAISFDQIDDVAIGDNGRIYVANEDDEQIVILDDDLDVISTFGSQCVGPEVPGQGCADPDGAGPLEIGDGQFHGPSGIAYGLNNRIVVADTSNDRIQVFDEDGNFILKFGIQGDGVGEFNIPAGVDVDNDGNIYVADAGNDRIQVFDEDGNFIRAFGSSCSLEFGTGCEDPDDGGPLELGDGQFAAAADVIVDYAGTIYVVDPFNNRVQWFTNTGGFRGKLSLPEDTAAVRGIAIDAKGRLHVTTSNASGTPAGVPFIIGVYEIDTDGDSFPDLWEQAGIDTDLDGEIEFDLTNAGTDYRGQTITADPNRKDIFVELDYFDCTVAGHDCDPGDTHNHRPRDEA
ncbi:MAG: NHL repeat-containing protein, partial [Pseudomonadota bacterium]